MSFGTRSGLRSSGGLSRETDFLEGLNKRFHGGFLGIESDGHDLLLAIYFDGLHTGLVSHTCFHLVLNVLRSDLGLKREISLGNRAFGLGCDNTGQHE